MAATAISLLVFVAVGLAVPIAIWLLVESETDRTKTMDRESAERLAREDSTEEADGSTRTVRRLYGPVRASPFGREPLGDCLDGRRDPTSPGGPAPF